MQNSGCLAVGKPGSIDHPNSEVLIEPLSYARPFILTEAEKKQIETFDEFPEAAAHRMGEDERRNDAIVRAVGKYATSGQVLLSQTPCGTPVIWLLSFN